MNMSHDTAPPTASAGIVPTPGDQGVIADVDTSLRSAAPANNAAEVATHTGVLNQLDGYFYEHFIRFTSFSWSTSQLTGHVLYSLPLSPYNLSAPLSYVMQLYNQWAGGFQIRIEVAGTGFNGGKLMFVRFPPNIDPDQYDINSATVFPYIMLDPKSQTSGILDIEDYRQQLFHWNQKFTDPYGKIQNTIGTFRVYVMLPLISSSLTTASINIQLSARLSKSFVVSQLVPPKVSTHKLETDYESLWRSISWEETVCRTMMAKQILFSPSTTSQIATELCTPIADPSVISIPLATNSTTGSKFYGDKINALVTCSGFVNTIRGTKENPRANFMTRTVSVSDPNETITDWAVTVGTWTSLDRAQENGPKIVAPNGESLVLFTCDSMVTGFPLVDKFIAIIGSGLFKDVEENMSIIYQLFDKSNKTPIAFLRLNPQGFFSTNKVTSNVHINFGDVEAKFYAKQHVTTPLPAVPNAFWTYAAKSLYQRMIDQGNVPTSLSERDSLEDRDQCHFFCGK